MHAMGVLASGVAHDLNHALNLICLRVATLRAYPQLGGARRALDMQARVVSDAARIVARLQDLARKRRDRPSDPLDLAAVLTGAIEMARTEAEIAGVRIEGGAIRVRARPERGRVQVTIAGDDGRAMSEQDLARLFDPFSGVARESAL